MRPFIESEKSHGGNMPDSGRSGRTGSNESGRHVMKRILLMAVVIGSFAPLHARQWCFSKRCTDTPATLFSNPTSSKQFDAIFRHALTLPAYTPVAPLRFSPSARQFVLLRPLNGIRKGIRLFAPSNNIIQGYDLIDRASESHQSAGIKGAGSARPGFSTGQVGFTSSPGR